MNFPYYANYQPNYQQSYQPQDNLQQYRQVSQDDRIFVQGELAAQAYLVAPNSFVRLWDSQQNVFYEKRADASGRPYMEAFEYKRKNPVAQNISDVNYDEKISALDRRIQALENMKGVVENVPKSDSNDTTV